MKDFNYQPDPLPQQMSYWQRLGIAIELLLAPVGGYFAVFAIASLLEKIR